VRRKIAAVSLFEIAVVVAVVSVLLLLSLPVYSKVRARAQRAQCAANLRSLYLAANGHVQEHGSWPQIRLGEDGDASARDYASEWIAALAPFGANTKTWICPAIENLLQNPGYTAPDRVRTDYVAMTFDDKPTTPHQWPRQPWFVERGDVHGHGNLMVLTDGSITDLKTVAAQPSR
jgi:Tfp pilus assembly protein FimT